MPDLISRLPISEADLSGSSGANLQRLPFGELVFQMRSWITRKLVDTDLTHADFFGARLVSADLSRAYLEGASFTGADLEGANLAGSDLRLLAVTSRNVFIYSSTIEQYET